ncbi:hypothetical protein V5279_23195 [Bradyrhizobium sp. 26S5]|uniref:hypothetical protein n=1 Tax=Bradyrhizobium sp. 26S5 TaxID=3139729 RepID=UPI0030D5F66A
MALTHRMQTIDEMLPKVRHFFMGCKPKDLGCCAGELLRYELSLNVRQYPVPTLERLRDLTWDY